jgi:cation diffusion facilitator CzcD-associated flavoprotein CzcO
MSCDDARAAQGAHPTPIEDRGIEMIDTPAASKQLKLVVIGAGMAGLLAGIRLKEAGFDDFLIFEKADRVAGTWRENRYPGLTCDIPSHAYTYSFAPNPNWTQRYPPGPEIYDYFSGLVGRYGLDAHIRFGKEVVSSVYQDGGWTLRTQDGEETRADAVIVATGLLHHPKYPDIEGRDTFAGRTIHSARWEDDAPLDGRVGVIGSGSTGVQIVAALAGTSQSLKHFQRTPQWIMPTVNTQFSEEERAAFHADENLLRSLHMTPEMEQGMRYFIRAVMDASSPEMAIIEGVALKNLEDNVQDPMLREKLRPNYRAACKRLIMSPDYYRKVQLPGVEVVVDKIDRIEPAGIRTIDGTLHEIDTLVFATGFHAQNFMRPMNVVGRNGTRLNDLWDHRPSAYLAIAVPDLPNFFLLNGPSAPFGNFSNIEVVERQMNFVMQMLDLLRAGEARGITVKRDAMARYDDELIEAVKGTIWSTGCSSWYLDADGIPTIWPFTFDDFIERTSNPRREDLELTH